MTLAIFSGSVMHVRHTPFRHAFRYRLWMLLLDLDAPARKRSPLFGHDQLALVTLRSADHGSRDGSPLRAWAETALHDHGLGEYAARIEFMFIPRVLGFAFNPIAFFFCRNIQGRLGAVIHQVKNTFGNQTAYVLPVSDNAPVGGAVRQDAAKQMHVSPFFDMAGGYRFSIAPPDARGFAIAIRYGNEATPRMTATLRLARQDFSTVAMLKLLARMPLMPFKVVAAIHWEALRLWLKGARYHSLPPRKPPAMNRIAVQDTISPEAIGP